LKLGGWLITLGRKVLTYERSFELPLLFHFSPAELAFSIMPVKNCYLAIYFQPTARLLLSQKLYYVYLFCLPLLYHYWKSFTT